MVLGLLYMLRSNNIFFFKGPTQLPIHTTKKSYISIFSDSNDITNVQSHLGCMQCVKVNSVILQEDFADLHCPHRMVMPFVHFRFFGSVQFKGISSAFLQLAHYLLVLIIRYLMYFVVMSVTKVVSTTSHFPMSGFKDNIFQE